MPVNIDQRWEKWNFWEIPSKLCRLFLGILVMKIQILVSLDKYFGDTANVKFGRFTASARPLFRAPRPGFEKTMISIEFKYHSTQIASYRIKRGWIHWVVMFLNWSQLEHFMDFRLNICKILRPLREQNIVKFQWP